MSARFLLGLLVLLCASGATGASAQEDPDPTGVTRYGYCPTEPAEITTMPMTGDGWDGPGQNAITITWHVDGTTSDFGDLQRTAIIDALEAWAGVVRITFRESAITNETIGIDLNFATGNHSAIEPQEAGDSDCPFDGVGGTIAHAGYPPGVNSLCINPMAETFAGNVHFDDAETWELDDTVSVDTRMSLTLVACHEIGHALGLTHSTVAGAVMRASVTSNDAFVGLQPDDITNIQAGYAAGTGDVITLNDTGVWVDRNWGGFERGTPTQPFNTVTEGASGVPPASSDIVVHIQAGNYPETLTITQNMILRAENGVVTIGQ